MRTAWRHRSRGRQTTAGRIVTVALVVAALVPIVGEAAHAAVPGPLFDMVVDEARGQIYGSARSDGVVHVIDMASLESVGSIDLGEGSQPTGLDLSPDGSELAVALFGAGQVAFVDLETSTVTATPAPDVTVGPNRPFDVMYGRAGRLYSVGNPGSGGLDYVHVFDTATHTEIGKSTEIMRAAPRLAMTDDENTLYVSQVIFSPQKIYRFDISTDTPVQTAAGPHGPMQVNTLAVNAAGTEVYSSRGQVWSGDLTTQLGSFAPAGEEIEYSAAHDRFYVTRGSAVAEYDATSHQPTVTRMLMSPGGVARVSGETLYVSTNLGIEALPLDLATKCGGRDATIIGSPGPDVIQGTAKIDVVLGLGGNDTIHGLQGNDRLCGGAGNDILNGGAGGDVLFGNWGSDELSGGTGNDRLYGGGGNDVLEPGNGADTAVGNAGRDLVVFSGATRRVVVDLAAGTASGQGADVLKKVEDVLGSPFDDVLNGDGKANVLSGGAGSDVIRGRGGPDTLNGGGGEDELWGGGASDLLNGGPGRDYLVGGAGSDDIRGQTGIDITSYEDSTRGVRVDLAAGSGAGWGADVLRSVENVIGSDHADTIFGNAGDNLMLGLGGPDTIVGRDGDDLAAGGDGDDTLRGGSGHDLLAGEEGDDTLVGGPGFDYASWRFAGGPVTASLITNTGTGQGTDTLSSMEGLEGGPYADRLTGNGAGNGLYGNAGADRLIANGGNDGLFGGSGNDNLSGGSGLDELWGGPGTDSLDGGPDFDVCYEGETVVNCEVEADITHDDPLVAPADVSTLLGWSQIWSAYLGDP